MSAETFLKDYKAYFVDQELSEYDEQRIKLMFQQHSKYKEITKITRVPVYKEKIVYIDRHYNECKCPEKPNKVDMDVIVRNADAIIRNICDYWGVDYGKLFTGNRTQYLVWCRYHIFLVLRGNGLTLPWIGDKFNRDHTTVIHGIQQANNLIETRNDPFYTMYTTWRKAQGMPEVWQEEAGNGVLHSEGEAEGGDGGVLLQSLHGVQEKESIVNVS